MVMGLRIDRCILKGLGWELILENLRVWGLGLGLEIDLTKFMGLISLAWGLNPFATFTSNPNLILQFEGISIFTTGLILSIVYTKTYLLSNTAS